MVGGVGGYKRSTHGKGMKHRDEFEFLDSLCSSSIFEIRLRCLQASMEGAPVVDCLLFSKISTAQKILNTQIPIHTFLE